MPNTISLAEPDVDSLVGIWTGLQLERGPASGGPFSVLVQIPYVAHQTTYTYSDATGSLSDWYRFVRYGPGGVFGTYSDAWPVTPAPSAPVDGARRSLRNTRRLLLRSLHSLTVVTTTSVGNTGGTSIVSRQLRTALNDSRYLHTWVMPVEGTTAREIRRVTAESALNLNTGELAVWPEFSAPVEVDVQVEISRLLPHDDDDGWVGARSCINRALSELWSPQRLDVSGVDGQPSYSLSTYEDWLDPDAVRELYAPAVDATLNPYARGGYDAVRAGGTLNLQVYPTLAADDAASLEVFRPSDTFIKVGGIWGASSVGLVNDSDEHLHHPEVVVTVALAHAYASLASGPDGNRYDALAQRQRLKANVLKLNHLDHRQPATGDGWSNPWGPKDGYWGTVLMGDG
jgi:hypothetical protein